VRLDATDQIARIRLAECWIGRLDFNAHHLPKAYLGNPQSDLRLAGEAESLAGQVSPLEQRTRLIGEIAACRQLIGDWMASQSLGIDFLTFRHQHGRELSVHTRVYVYGSSRPTKP
jgi:hypothetical protein